jgi:hypothetical protein
MTYDAFPDAAHVRFTYASAARSEGVSPDIVHEFDRAGRLLAIEGDRREGDVGGRSPGQALITTTTAWVG